jgi:hypothetical protein
VRQPALALALAILALGLAGGGCAAHMKVATSLEEGAEGWAVSGASPRSWGTPVAFGPWRAQPVTGGVRGWSFDVLGIDAKAAATARPQDLRVEGPAGGMEVECLPQTLQAVAPFGVAVDLEAVGGTLALACAFRPSGSTGWAAAWTLLLRATGQPTQAYEGQLRDARGVTFTVRSIHQLDGGKLQPGRPVGYALDREGTPAAAVELLEAGRVLIPRRESEAAALSAAAVALLLFQPGG